MPSGQKPASPDSRSSPPGHRYPGLHGKVVDWVEHKFEEGLLYLHVRFTDKTELCWRIATRMRFQRLFTMGQRYSNGVVRHPSTEGGRSAR